MNQIQNLPQSFRKLVVKQLNNDFDKATELITVSFDSLLQSLKPNQVIVKYHYVGINASDINYTAGRYDPSLLPPFDCGFEGLGVVVVKGSSTTVTLLQPVAVMAYGTFSEYQIVNERLLIPLPSVDKRFLALPVSGLTASLALQYHGLLSGPWSGHTSFDEQYQGLLKSNQVVLVTAAAGGAGQMACQLAKLAGIHVIGTCSNGKEGFLKSIGVDRVINYKTESVQDVLKKEYPKGVDIVFESVGGKMFETCLKALAIKGRMVVIGAISSYAKSTEGPMNVFNWDTVKTNQLLGKSTTVTGFFLNHYYDKFDVTMKKLTDLVQVGKLKPVIHGESFVGLESISDAIKCMHSGKNVGKVVVQIHLSSKF